MGTVDSSPEMGIARRKLRERWELASVLNFLTVFEPVVQIKLKISAEEIETALIEPNDNLAQLHILLLKGIPPVSKLLKDSNGWVIALSKKLEMWWPWVAEGNFPLTTKKGEEVSTYKALNPTTRPLVLKALCEIRADQDDTVAYINDGTKSRNNSTLLSAKRSLGAMEMKSHSRSTFHERYDGNEAIGHRLYKEVYQVKSMPKLKDKKRISAVTSRWETLATTFEEFELFITFLLLSMMDNFSLSQVKWEGDVGKAVEAHAIHALRKIRKKDMAAKRQQRDQRLLEGLRNLAFPRSCRIRRPINYGCDDFDRAIKEAIEVTNMATKNETNSLDSSPASNSISGDTTDTEAECDKPQGSNEDVDDTGDEDDEGDPDEDDADSMKENSRLYHRPAVVATVRDFFGVSGYALPESSHIGAKNRLRRET
ncbi:unnamed protein product [Withania somnifera]